MTSLRQAQARMLPRGRTEPGLELELELELALKMELDLKRAAQRSRRPKALRPARS